MLFFSKKECFLFFASHPRNEHANQGGGEAEPGEGVLQMIVGRARQGGGGDGGHFRGGAHGNEGEGRYRFLAECGGDDEWVQRVETVRGGIVVRRIPAWMFGIAGVAFDPDRAGGDGGGGALGGDPAEVDQDGWAVGPVEQLQAVRTHLVAAIRGGPHEGAVERRGGGQHALGGDFGEAAWRAGELGRRAALGAVDVGEHGFFPLQPLQLPDAEGDQDAQRNRGRDGSRTH